MSPRAWLLFTASSVIWGVPYFFVKVAVDAGVPPGFVAWSRVTLAAVLLLPLAWRRGALRGLGPRAGTIVAYAACEIAVPFILIAVGQQYVSSSLTAILIASMPLMVAVLAIRFAPGEQATGVRLVGLVVGLAGVAALLGVDVAGRPGELLGAALVLLATLCYAIAPIVVQRGLLDLDPIGPVTASLVLSSAALLPVALASPPSAVPAPGAVWSLVLLGVLCTAVGLVVFFRLIAEAGAGRASVITYVNPLVAVLLGVLVLDERLGPASVAGLALILGGSWLATAAGRRTTGDEVVLPS